MSRENEIMGLHSWEIEAMMDQDDMPDVPVTRTRRSDQYAGELSASRLYRQSAAKERERRKREGK